MSSRFQPRIGRPIFNNPEPQPRENNYRQYPPPEPQRRSQRANEIQDSTPQKQQQRTNEVQQPDEKYDQQPAQDSEYEEVQAQVKNFRISDDPPPLKKKSNLKVRQPPPQEPYYDEDYDYYSDEESQKKKPRKPSLWSMYQKSMRESPEIKAMAPGDRQKFIANEWKRYKESTSADEREDHKLRYQAQQVVRGRLSKKKEEEYIKEQEAYFDSLTAEEEARGGAYDNVFKVNLNRRR